MINGGFPHKIHSEEAVILTERNSQNQSSLDRSISLNFRAHYRIRLITKEELLREHSGGPTYFMTYDEVYMQFMVLCKQRAQARMQLQPREVLD